ncbi:BCS1 N terminal-domain-containing protein [Xylaria bambusicola]|uniref:BCS1 N terminal-domain-containing protein n=1 Tax=Xylaria bambusicola TaxID=326684 RepID=UPI002007D6D3|nr:BCS1 N terminal-domain-containing protein [Xylaria bambusicola]KAI0505501.1 BCS1 N terminal-domain-containing protein [Xylaria bambusicola]
MADPSLSSCPSYGAGPTQNAAFPGSPPPQLALLDMFFPGFSMFAGAFQRYFYVDLNLYIPLLLFLGMLMVCWNYASGYLWDQVETYFMSVVDIRTDDEIYNILMAWVATQRFSQGARKFVVNTSLSSRSWYLWRWNDDDDDDEFGYGEGLSGDKKKKKALSYTPSFGSHYFWYRGRLLLFRRSANREQNSFMLVSEREEISISCFGRNPWILKELLLEAREKYILKDEHKTQIYRGTTKAMSSEPSWQRCMSRASRPFSTVILNEQKKKELVDDVTDYLNPMTQRWYANRGIPYRRGYLLHGPPGTGKSSLSLALAGFFKLRIYIVSLSSVNATEENLGNLFAELPRRCVVLLEDIDSAGLTHTREDNKNPPPKEEEMEPGQVTRGNGNTNDNNNTPSFRLSLSGLLNILDGVASQEGRILIMTTNHPEKLDKALIRPGRVDMIIGFGLADEYMVINIFRNIFAYLEGDDGPEVEKYIKLTPEEREVVMEKRKKERLAHDAKMEELAKTFASKIPAHEFSPAELQGHLMKNKHNPQNAIDTAEEFIEKTRAEHKEKERKAAEEKRKAEEKKKEDEQKKVEEEKKKAEEEEKKMVEEEIKKKVEEEIEKKFGSEIREKVKAEMEKKKAEEEAKKLEEEKNKEKDKEKEKEATKSNNESSSDTKPDASSDPATKSATTADEKAAPVAPAVDRIIVKEEKKSDDDDGSRQDSGYGTPLSETHEAVVA